MVLEGGPSSIMQASTVPWERVLEVVPALLRLQPAASLHQAIADSASRVFEASGTALFIIEDDGGVLTAAAGASPAWLPGARETTEALLNAAEPGTLAVPLRADDTLLAVLRIQAQGARAAALETSGPLRLFAAVAATALGNARDYQHVVGIDSRRQDDIATLVHELRNPLGAIVNTLRVLERLGAPDERTLQLRQLIGRQTSHLTRLVEDILDLARLRHGKLRFEPQPVDLRDVVRLVVDTVRASGRAGDHEVRDDLGTVALVVDGDVTRLEQVVRNLVDNAVKYSPHGTAITVTTERRDTMAVLRVRDEGIGIAANMLPRLFEPFAQAEAGGRRAAGGLGLGLPLVQIIVEQHQGTITAHSDGLGKGSEFVVQLPLRSSA
jgi:signal transduction histidine kinase